MKRLDLATASLEREEMSTAFTINFDQTSEQDSPEKAREQVSQVPRGPQEEENGQQEGSHPDILAWEVEFTGTGNDSSQQKTKKMPKFLREREKARQARMEQLKRESETTPRSTSPQATSKRLTNSPKSPGSPQVVKSKIPSPKFSASSTSKQRMAPPPRPASAQAGSISSRIKRSPPIKQPLLLVQSGHQGKSAERGKASNSPLTGNSRSPNNSKPLVRPTSAKTSRELNKAKSRSYTSLIRPTSARTSREQLLSNRRDKGFTADFNSPPRKEEEKVTKEATPLKSKKVFLNHLLYAR